MYCSASAMDWIRSSCRMETDWRTAEGTERTFTTESAASGRKRVRSVTAAVEPPTLAQAGIQRRTARRTSPRDPHRPPPAPGSIARAEARGTDKGEPAEAG